jgi:WD40 repeat protein
MCKVFSDNEELIGVFLVTACNEVVILTNIKTGEQLLKIYDEEALHGYVTCIQVSADLLAIGYSSGTILVYKLKLSLEEDLEKVHQFSFHRSPVTSIEFLNDNT